MQGNIYHEQNNLKVEIAESSTVSMQSISQEGNRIEMLSVTLPQTLEINNGSVLLGSANGASMSLTNALLSNVSIPELKLTDITYSSSQRNTGYADCSFKMKVMAPVAEINDVVFSSSPLMHFYIQDVKETQAGLLQVQLVDNARKHAADLKKGDKFVITLKYGRGGASFLVTRSSNCRLENNTFYTAKYGMTHGLSDNRGRIHVKGVKITFKPGSDRLISTPKDGFHCKHNTIGPGAAPAAISQGIRLKNCKDVVQETNKLE